MWQKDTKGERGESKERILGEAIMVSGFLSKGI